MFSRRPPPLAGLGRMSGTTLASGALLLLSGCAAPPAAPPVHALAEHEQRLADAATRVADALAKLAIVEQSARQIHAQALTPAAIPAELRLPVAVDYQGDLKPLVYQLARTVGYTVKVYGRAALLTPVTVVTESRSVGEILADVGYQAGYRCDVVIVPGQRVVELRYARRAPLRRG